MKKWILAFALALTAGGAWAGELTTLNLYTWSDYFDPEVVAQFEREHQCRVVIDYFDSNEAMFAKINGGARGYDLLTPSSYMVSVMRQQNLLMKFDPALVPNTKNIDPGFLRFSSDDAFTYSVPYTRTVTGVGFNTEQVEAPKASWAIFGDARYAGRMTMLNDMREAMGAALKYLGHSLNTRDDAEIDAARDLLIQWKKNLAKFEVDEAKRGLGAGEFFAVQLYNGDVALVMQESEDVSFFIPEEGSSVASDDFVIPTFAKQPELAMAFVNYMLDTETAAANMEGILYYMPIPEALELVDEELRNNRAFNIPTALLGKCEVIQDLGADNAKYTRAWDAVRAAE
jgi:spermidine/putrescine transport system substrate-binding protein